MPKIFTEENKDVLRRELLEEGFILLKKGGFTAVNIDTLTRKCFIAKGTFYNLFKNKSDFMYQMMLHERTLSKSMLYSFLDNNNKLSSANFSHYLHWLAKENPNIFSYLTESEQKRLISSWPSEYLQNETNDNETMHMLYSLLETPKKNPSWELACNYMKLIATSLSMKDVFISSHYKIMLDKLIDEIVNIMCE